MQPHPLWRRCRPAYVVGVWAVIVGTDPLPTTVRAGQVQGEEGWTRLGMRLRLCASCTPYWMTHPSLVW